MRQVNDFPDIKKLDSEPTGLSFCIFGVWISGEISPYGIPTARALRAAWPSLTLAVDMPYGDGVVCREEVVADKRMIEKR